MNRRDSVKLLSLALGSAAIPRLPRFEYLGFPSDPSVLETLRHLEGEPPATASVRFERGGPRLYVNGKEEYPFMAGSMSLSHTIKSFQDSGIRLFHPLVSLEDGWTGPGTYDWGRVDQYFAMLLSKVPDALFYPRLHVYAPDWWKNSHPDELAQYGLPVDKKFYKLEQIILDSKLNWNVVIDEYAASLASTLWKTDMGETLKDFLRHVEASPLKSRIIGYHLSGGMTAEWHHTGSRHLPDYSKPMQQLTGGVPSVDERIHTTLGLLRDPEKERPVIDFYRLLHENTTNTVLYYAGITKAETQRRILTGTFFCYVLENVCVQEAGHLAPEKVLESRDLDLISSPYAYQHGNIPGKQRWESDLVDDAGNWLGRARGVGGDGGYRTLLESLRRHKKLFIAELDPSTYIEPEKTTEGGSGKDTVEGTLQILRRDLTQVFAQGNGGWLFEFGHVPPFKANRGWYDDAPMIKEIRSWLELGQRTRPKLETRSVANIAAIYDIKSFLVTQHWKAEEPYSGFGIAITDFFNHWLLNSQTRTLHRIGAPVDFLYRADLKKEDVSRYRLLFMPNVFYLTKEETLQLKNLLKGSKTTVVWYYAPGYVGPERFMPSQMEDLTGFQFKRMDQPGTMMIQCDFDYEGTAIQQKFGVKKEHFPRFAVIGSDPSVQVLGKWADADEVAFARTMHDGFESVYVGSGPLPVEILRWLAGSAGVKLWSSKPDAVRATRDAVAILASSDGERTLRLPSALAPAEGGTARKEYQLDMRFGDVRVFVKKV
jgi:hypothetical protein